MTYNIILVLGVPHNTLLYVCIAEWLPQVFYLSTELQFIFLKWELLRAVLLATFKYTYSIIDDSLHAITTSSGFIYLITHFVHLSNPCLWQLSNHQSIAFLYLWVFVFLLFCLDSTYKGNHTVFIFLCLSHFRK